MAATNSAFRTETRDEPIYNHLELFNMPSSSIEAPAANDYQHCREQQPTGNIGKGRRMFSDYRTERNNEHLYSNVESVNKPSLPAIESRAVNQTSQDDSRGQQPTGNSTTIVLRVLYAMIAVLALAFLAMLASLIALHWEHVKSSGTNGDLDLDGIQQQLTNVEGNISLLANQNLVKKMVAKIIEQVSSNQTEGRRLLETKIENQTLELNQINCAGCQDCRILNEVKQQLKEVLENLNYTVSKIRDKVSSIQTGDLGCSTLLDNKFNPLISKLEEWAARVDQTDYDPWIKMNESPICFGAGKNQFGSFKVPSNGTLASVKLVHVDGYVRCNVGNPQKSFWGCIQDPTNEVNVEIKAADTVILPSKEFLVKKSGENRSLVIPGYDSLSKELVLSADFSNPPKVTKGQWLRLSLREDLLSSHKEKSCCDVYARFSETTA